jgi:hypothetical protein
MYPRASETVPTMTGAMMPNRSDNFPIRMLDIPKPHHRQCVRQRRRAARDAEFRLHGGQRDDNRPHADAADRGKHERDDQARPRVGRFHLSVQLMHADGGWHCGSSRVKRGDQFKNMRLCHRVASPRRDARQ